VVQDTLHFEVSPEQTPAGGMAQWRKWWGPIVLQDSVIESLPDQWCWSETIIKTLRTTVQEETECYLSFPRFLGAFFPPLLLAKRTHSLTAARLRWLSRQQWRQPSGFFRFPFGRVHYTDASALAAMFEELFLSQVYAVGNLPDRPYIVDCGGNIGLKCDLV